MKKIAIIYESLNSGTKKKAVEILSKLLLDYTYEYPLCFPENEKPDINELTTIYITTDKTSLNTPEEYSITVKDGSIYITGYDDQGMLYGCIDFYNKYILKHEFPHDPDRFRVNPFEKELPDFQYTSHPSIKDRGIWTWGHVIYDWRSFLDNMVMLKMNTVIIWNDFVPVNAKDIVEYAHNCGIKVIWGFSWCWDTDCSRFSLDIVNSTSQEVFEKYEKEYSALGGDGIYFQSFTELDTDNINGVLIAEAVTDYVNKTSELFLQKYPELELQFGLHATSVKEKLQYIKKINPQIRIVWENCGAFPFSYLSSDIKDFDETKEFVKEIASLRSSDDKFGVVTKGFTKLDWDTFEHMDGSLNIGTSTKFMKRDRIARKSRIWKHLQAYWLINADKAYEMLKLMADEKDGDLCVTALIEDGMFEENIMFPAALFSEMMWNTDADVREMTAEVASRNYVDFA